MTGMFVMLVAAAAGLLLGWFHFAGLWQTVSVMRTRPNPTAWIMLSSVARLAVALAVFVLLARWGGWPALVVALSGFVVARTFYLYRWRRRIHTPESS